MGLDISVYEKVTFVRTRATDDNYWGEGDYWGDGEDLEALSNEEDFRERSDGLADGLYKTSGKRDHFRAGSYGGYNEWRRELAQLVGVSARWLWSTAPDDERARATPFYELINFSDCNGFIGPATSAKLAKDFAAWQEKAGTTGYFAEKYAAWRAAFELAANGGVVQFH